MRNDHDRVAHKCKCSSQRDPFKDPLLRLRNVIVDRLFDEVASGVGCGERLASWAGCGGFGDISIRISGCDAADCKGGQKEEHQEDWVGVLEHCDCLAEGGSMAPSLGFRGGEAQIGHLVHSSHDVGSLHVEVRPGCEGSPVAEGNGEEEGDGSGREVLQ